MTTKKKDWKGWFYVAPVLILMAIFTFYPLIRTILISFDPVYDKLSHKINYSAFSFANYKNIIVGKVIDGKLYPDSYFKNSLKNTLLIVFISVPASTILALAISVSLMSIKRVRSFFQTIYFLPYITNTIAIGMVFAVMFNYNNGLINAFLKKFGVAPINWVNQAGHGYGAPSKLALMTVAQIYIIWQALPFKILIFMGGLQSINPQYYQAAQIDGASKWRVFRKITVPLLSPMIMYIVITSLIGSFKTYSAIIGLFEVNSPQLDQMQTLVGYVYKQLESTSTGSYSQGAAAAVLLFLIILVFTAVNAWVSKKKVHF